MRRAWRFWVDVTSGEERGTTLALFRIAVALVMMTTLLSLTRAGVVDAWWVGPSDGGVRPITSHHIVLTWLGGPSPRVVWSLVGICGALCAAMAAGLGGRATVFGAALSYHVLSSINHAAGGYDSMIGNAAWLLFLSDCTRTLSVDCRRRTGRWTSTVLVPAWPRLLLLGQLVLIYTATGLQKTSASWTFADGYSALYWFLQDPTWIRFDMSWAADVYTVTQVMTASVWHFEVGAPLLLLVLYFRRTGDRSGRARALFNRYDLRLPWAAFGVSMHLGIAVLLEMGPFSWISLAFYLCLFSPAELEALAAGRSRQQRKPI